MITESEVIARVRREIARAGTTALYAARIGAHVSNMYSFLGGKARPSRAILRALGLKRVVAYVRVERAAETEAKWQTFQQENA